MTEANTPGVLGRLDQTGAPLLVARLIIGGWFIVYGIKKISADPVVFLRVLEQYHLLPMEPAFLLNGFAVTLPFIEVLAGLALVLGVAVRAAGFLLSFLMVTFTAAIYLRGLGVQAETGQALCDIVFDCGCGAGPINICRKFGENSVLFLISLIPIVSRSRRFCLGATKPLFR